MRHQQGLAKMGGHQTLFINQPLFINKKSEIQRSRLSIIHGYKQYKLCFIFAHNECGVSPTETKTI